MTSKSDLTRFYDIIIRNSVCFSTLFSNSGISDLSLIKKKVLEGLQGAGGEKEISFNEKKKLPSY